jgi:hypothetical protein
LAVRIITAAILVLSVAVLALANAPPSTDCSSSTPDDQDEKWFRAIRIVVQPWWGPHHVYGVFSVPLRYKRDRLYTARLMIEGLTEDPSNETPEGEDFSSGPTVPGHYIKRMYLPTKTALVILATGRFGDLKKSCHWWLIIADRIE